MPVNSIEIDGRPHYVFDKKKQLPTKTGYKTHEQSIQSKLNGDDDFTIKKIPNNIRLKIIELRRNQKLNQADLAKKCNVNTVLIQKCESGEANYEPALFNKIAKGLGVNSLKK